MKIYKTLALIVLVSLLIPGSLPAEVKVSAGGGLFNPSDQRLTDFYGKGTFFNGSIYIKIIDKFDVWSRYESLKREGITSVFETPIILRLNEISLGANYYFSRKILRPYIGLGLVYADYSESTNPKITGHKISYMTQAGIQLKLEGFFFDFFVNYRTIKVHPEEVEVDLGGFVFGGSLGFCFFTKSQSH